MSTQKINWEVYDKTLKVIRSCKNFAQIRVAVKYIEFALRNKHLDLQTANYLYDIALEHKSVKAIYETA